MAGKKHQSLESMVDEERREVLALLERTTADGRPRGSVTSARALSPLTTPKSPVRSMLDIDAAPASARASRHSSLPGTSGGLTSPPIRSMLDIYSPIPPPPGSSASASEQYLSMDTNKGSAHNIPPRSLSDTGSRPVHIARDLTSEYQFSGFLKSNPGGPVIPKRNTQAGKKTPIVEVLGPDLSTSRDSSGRSRSLAGTGINVSKSRSPSNRLGLRSNSPRPDSCKYALDDGTVIDMTSAYRRFSDANLAKSGGGLSSLSGKSQRRRTNSVEEAGAGRLVKDILEDSTEEEYRSTDEEFNRGRMKEGRGQKEDGDHSPESSTLGMGRAKGPRTAQSLLAAAEEERQQIAAKYKVRSLLDPEITVTAPLGDKLKSSRPGVHPNTSFDQGLSGLSTPLDSDTEADLTDIKRAQKLSVHMTPITSTPATNRCVRTIYRGDFGKMQQEAMDHQRRVRKYLVATDLSDEAAHALEWTVGTVLRDGDTLLAIYCVDEELGIAPNDANTDDPQMKEQVAAIAASTKPPATPELTPTAITTPLGRAFKLDTNSPSASPMGRWSGKAEQERYRAVHDITDRVSKLLRKTKLQVKVVIEVIHCKSPKHLITEVIDYISPTLVILGSRGRSALKGVILGSFSNYLVTKSSVPVMVARKRLRKHTKYKHTSIRLANNLSNPTVKSLAAAKID